MIFEIQDKSGRLIHLSKKQYVHISEHSMLTNKIEQIKETIVCPDSIVQSPADLKVCYYFRFYKELSLFLLVVIKYLNGTGFVITAYYTHKRTI